MASINLIEAFQELKDIEKIDRPTMMKVVEEVFRNMIRKKYGTDENFDIIINPQKGDFEIFRTRVAVKDNLVEDELTEIPLNEAQKIEADFQEGEDVMEAIHFSNFGRRAIWTAKLNLAGKINELKKNTVIKKYNSFLGEIITGEIYQIWKREILILDDEGSELILPKGDQIPKDFFKKGDIVKAIVKRVDIRGGNPLIIVSRTTPEFLAKLMEMEVPEIFDGLIVIKKVVRDPGERAKVAVESFDDRIDPVGACVGVKGSRIHGIVRELRNENIDIINWTTNSKLFIQRSLQLANTPSIELNEDKKHANIYTDPEDVSMAIGRRGVNIKLACQLTGYELDIYRNEDKYDDEYDVNIEEFGDEIESWIIDELKKIGCDTGKSVLQYTQDEVERRTDLEKETVEEIFKIIKTEFEKA